MRRWTEREREREATSFVGQGQGEGGALRDAWGRRW